MVVVVGTVLVLAGFALGRVHRQQEQQPQQVARRAEVRHWWLVGWAGMGLVLLSALVPWVRSTSTDEARAYGYLFEADLPTLVVFAVPVAACIAWLAGRLSSGLVASSAGLLLVIGFAVLVPVANAADTDGSIEAGLGIALALTGYALLTGAAALARSTPRVEPEEGLEPST